MVDLPKVNDSLITSQAPQSSVSANEVRRQYSQAAGAAMEVADAFASRAKENGKTAAAEDLMHQKVVSNADGSVTVENPASAPLLFGDAKKTYDAAIITGTAAQHDNVISEKMTELHKEFPTDPHAFQAAATAFIDKHTQGISNPRIGAAVKQTGDQLATQHFNSITNTAANIDIENQKKSITANIDSQTSTLIALARQGGTDTPEFKQALDKLNLSYDALGINPLFKTPPDQIEIQKNNTAALLQGEAVVAHVDSTFSKRGKGDAQKELNEKILQNPNLREADRSRLYTQGLSRLAYLTADAKETITANRQITTELESGLSKGTVKPEDPAVGQAIQRARDIGDAEGAQRITAAQSVARQMRGVNALPNAIRSEVLGVPTGSGEPVNKNIPAEGRALLKVIGQTESRNRYDVRYSGAGPRIFTDYGDHPRVAETITSGPDAGKTSSAAGYYQFIGPTWDAQAKKLGLKDFSPENQDAAAWDLAQITYKQKTGKDLLTTLKSGDTSDVLPALSGQWSSLPGGRQPARQYAAPAANGGRGFTDQQVKENPFLLSAYFRTLAQDPELRVQSAKQTAQAVGKALDNGIFPSPASVAEVNQAAQLYPDKMGSVAEEMNGKLLGQQIAKLPQAQRDQFIEQYKRATDGQDVHHINIATAALKQAQDADKNLKDHPYDEAARRGWTDAPMPIDVNQPDGIVPAIAQRAQLSQRIGALNQSPPPPILDSDDVGKLSVALQGPQGPALLTGISGALKPDDLKALFGQKDFANAVTGMMASKDPARMSAAMSIVDQRWRQNAAEAESQFGSAAITRLQAWQALKDSFGPQELADRLNASDDPSTVKAREIAKEQADKETKSLTPADMAYKIGTGWPVIGRLTGSTPAAPFDSIKGGELVADFNATYTALRTYGVDPDKASELAVKRLSTTWAPSAAGGNQVMKNPPERYYPQINGSSDWIGDDLKSWVSGKAGPEFSGDGRRSLEIGMAGVARDRNWQIAGLISDGQTQSEISNGRPPSYQVAIKRADGTLDIIPSRIAFDPSDHIAKQAANLQQKRANIQDAREMQFQSGAPQP